MINRHQPKYTNNDSRKIIIRFGNTPLVQITEGKLEMKGATKAEQTDAKEFISLFMHESVVSFVE
jgi:hypothetical protein